jgi:beta-glucoside PTS system EIICBA component
MRKHLINNIFGEEKHMASKYDGLARIIIQNVGGKANVIDLEHCITRLRFRLKDVSGTASSVRCERSGGKGGA